MGKITIFIFLLLLSVLGFLAIENKDAVAVKIPFGSIYEMPKIALILLSATIGALVILIIFFVRDTKRVIANLHSQKRQKKEAKIQEIYAKALDAILGNKEEEAKEALGDILKEDPDNTNALLKLGDIAFIREDYEKALEHYRKARDIHPSNLQALLSIAAVKERLRNYDDALKYIEEILDKDSENLTALSRKRSLLEKKERWDDLLSVQKAIIKLQSNEKEQKREEQRLVGYKYEYARSSLEGGEPEKAEKAFRTVIKMDGTFIPAYLGLAEVMLTKRETEEAINLLEKGFEHLASPILLARLEDMLISVGEPGRLIRFYKNALSTKPFDIGLKLLLGKLYSRLEMVDDALETLDTIDTNVLATPELHSLKGELYLKRNQLAKAIDAYRHSCGIKQSFAVPYCCKHCGWQTEEWSGRCFTCREWNTYQLDIFGECRGRNDGK